VTGCVFCRLIAEDRFEGQRGEVVWFEPRNPVVPGHLLFVPLEHVADACTDALVTAHVMSVAAQLVKNSGDGNFIWNVGPAAGQTVFHAHLHWVPRTPGDGLTMPWTGQIKERAS
jgi:histidine triad (HIT) family protein